MKLSSRNLECILQIYINKNFLEIFLKGCSLSIPCSTHFFLNKLILNILYYKSNKKNISLVFRARCAPKGDPEGKILVIDTVSLKKN